MVATVDFRTGLCSHGTLKARHLGVSAPFLPTEMRLEARDRNAVAEITARALTLGVGAVTPVLEEITPDLKALLDADLAGAYRASPSHESRGWKLDFDYGFSPKLHELLEQYFANSPTDRPLYGYDMLSPEPEQRNVVRHPTLDLPERVYRKHSFFLEVMEPAGVAHFHQMRTLLCDGPVLLAWVGALRAKRFTRREAAILKALIAPLKTRLLLERRIARAELIENGLAAAMDRIPGITVLATRDGRIAHASAAARSQLDADPELRGTWVRALSADVPGVRRVSVRAPGCPEHFLLTIDPARGAGTALDAKLRAAQRVWKLTPRQTLVLERVVQGDANKQIAERLRCNENTIEVHVSALLRKAHVPSRVGLTVKFWTSLDS